MRGVRRIIASTQIDKVRINLQAGTAPDVHIAGTTVGSDFEARVGRDTIGTGIADRDVRTIRQQQTAIATTLAHGAANRQVVVRISQRQIAQRTTAKADSNGCVVEVVAGRNDVTGAVHTDRQGRKRNNAKVTVSIRIVAEIEVVPRHSEKMCGTCGYQDQGIFVEVADDIGRRAVRRRIRRDDSIIVRRRKDILDTVKIVPGKQRIAAGKREGRCAVKVSGTVAPVADRTQGNELTGIEIQTGRRDIDRGRGIGKRIAAVQCQETAGRINISETEIAAAGYLSCDLQVRGQIVVLHGD